jgi:hypothetical protein
MNSLQDLPTVNPGRAVEGPTGLFGVAGSIQKTLSSELIPWTKSMGPCLVHKTRPYAACLCGLPIRLTYESPILKITRSQFLDSYLNLGIGDA